MTIDDRGTQTAIAEKSRSKRGEYVMALKENQKTLYEDVRIFLNDVGIKEELSKMENYKKQLKKPTVNWKSGNITRQKEIGWLSQKERLERD